MPQRFLNESLVLSEKKNVEKLLGLKNKAHEISLSIKNKKNLQDLSDLKAKISTLDAKLESWAELIPSLKAIFEMSAYSNIIVAGLLFFFIFFTVMNTLYVFI